MYDTLYAILNKRENAKLQYFIFCEKVFTKAWHQASDSSKLHRFVPFDVRVMFLFVFKALFTYFYKCTCARKIVMLFRIRHTCVALLRKKTVLSLETSSEINFESIKFLKNREY